MHTAVDKGTSIKSTASKDGPIRVRAGNAHILYLGRERLKATCAERQHGAFAVS